MSIFSCGRANFEGMPLSCTRGEFWWPSLSLFTFDSCRGCLAVVLIFPQNVLALVEVNIVGPRFLALVEVNFVGGCFTHIRVGSPWPHYLWSKLPPQNKITSPLEKCPLTWVRLHIFKTVWLETTNLDYVSLCVVGAVWGWIWCPRFPKP